MRSCSCSYRRIFTPAAAIARRQSCMQQAGYQLATRKARSQLTHDAGRLLQLCACSPFVNTVSLASTALATTLSLHLCIQSGAHLGCTLANTAVYAAELWVPAYVYPIFHKLYMQLCTLPTLRACIIASLMRYPAADPNAIGHMC